MSKAGLKIAVVGATGAVGQQLMKILEERKFPVSELVPFATARSVGKPITLNGKTYACRELQKGCFDGVQIAFFDASDAVSKEWVTPAAEAGAWVVDNSAQFRAESDIPLLVPEVNGHLIEERMKLGARITPRQRILSGPNCSTVQLVMALKPLRDLWGLKRVVVSTYQSVSGAGAAAMDELTAQTEAVAKNQSFAPKAFTHRIAFNCIPQIGGFKDDGYTGEEQKIMAETRKILGLPNLRINATAVRVPTYSCHGESVNVECDRSVTPAQFRESLHGQAGLIVQDDPAHQVYPLGATFVGDSVEAGTGRDAVYVGRIRKDESVDHGLSFWVVSDNLRKGAALNAVQIGEMLLRSLA